MWVKWPEKSMQRLTEMIKKKFNLLPVTPECMGSLTNKEFACILLPVPQA
jgi:hypothetical protein